MAVYTPIDRLAMPCGVCLQVMVEFMPLEGEVLIFADIDTYSIETLEFYLPHPFTKKFLI